MSNILFGAVARTYPTKNPLRVRCRFFEVLVDAEVKTRLVRLPPPFHPHCTDQNTRRIPRLLLVSRQIANKPPELRRPWPRVPEGRSPPKSMEAPANPRRHRLLAKTDR